MTITEPARHRLYEKLEGLLGEEADTLMAHLPPVGWADVATKADLDQLHDRIQVDLADLRIEMVELRAELHRDLADFKAEIRQDMADFRAEVRKEMADFRDELRRDRIAAQRQLLFVALAAAISLAATLASHL